MNALSEVHDINHLEVRSRSYDIALFASGYETRCTYLARQLSKDCAKVIDILGFSETHELLPENRAAHDQFFLEHFLVRPAELQMPLELKLQSHLMNLNRDRSSGTVKILVDYSSMSRAWYASVINFARYANFDQRFEVDFCYSVGEYGDSFKKELSELSVDSIITLPGFEGLSATREESIAVLGLGFTPLAAFGALEKLQPTQTLAYYADPGAKKDSADVCRSANEPLLRSADFQVALPLRSVELVYKRLAESLAPYLKSRQITLIPMGPKPHVLAALLLSAKFRPMACLYAKTSRRKVSDIPATGEVIVSRAIFEPVGISTN